MTVYYQDEIWRVKATFPASPTAAASISSCGPGMCWWCLRGSAGGWSDGRKIHRVDLFYFSLDNITSYATMKLTGRKT